MKPREFDDLIRQKFDQNDFEYNPRQWEDLAARLGNGKNKRSAIIVWLMPLLSMAATVTVALAIPTIVRMAQPVIHESYAYNKSDKGNLHAVAEIVTDNLSVNRNSKKHNNLTNENSENENSGFKINAKYALTSYNASSNAAIDLLAKKTPEDKKKKQDDRRPIRTFKPDNNNHQPTFSLTILGGYNYNSQNLGYILGTNARKMITSNMYIETDVAFISSNNNQQSAYQVQVPATANHTYNTGRTMNSGSLNASRTESMNGDAKNIVNDPSVVIKNTNDAYTTYYAQVAPGLGWKLSQKISFGAGPDFQQILVDNVPAPSSVDRNNVAVAPMFDIGLLGKTEYAVSKKLKAAFYYRKGINNFLTPMDKYTDRNYMQFQVKYTLFNK